ncbi:hypothetical protein [Salmonella enterica]|nr:hypothetical protein [Salmonella enterica]
MGAGAELGGEAVGSWVGCGGEEGEWRTGVRLSRIGGIYEL